MRHTLCAVFLLPGTAGDSRGTTEVNASARLVACYLLAETLSV